VTPLGAGVWTGVAEYGFQLATADDTTDQNPPDDSTHLGPEWSFDTQGGQQHLTQSKETKSKTKRGGGTAEDYKQAVGVTRDSVEGVDVFAPKLEFTVTLQRQFVNLKYVRTLRGAVGKTNSAPWYGFDTGEVLYLGCSGQAKPGERFSITHKFAAGENIKAGDPRLVICTGLTLPAKGAWEYVWCSYADAVDSNLRVRLPVSAYVERVYDSTDFTALFAQS
jgi:hypothetical protein